jgi:octopine/nopaline transport system substrate-binding protein
MKGLPVMKRSIAAIALALSCLNAAWNPVRADDKKWTELRIATEGAFRPWNYTNADGSLGGFEIDLYQDLCRRMEVRCSMIAQPFDSLIPALNAGKFDAIIAGMSATAKREQVIAFSISYGTTGQTFATLKSGPLAALPEKDQVFSLETDEPGAAKAVDRLKPLLKGKIVGVQTASIAAGFLDKYLKDIVEIREYKTTEQHDLDLLAGRVDLVMASMAYLSTAAAKPGNQDMIVVGPRFQGGMLGRGSSVGLRKTDPELKVMFDKAIREAQADGTIKTLSAKYFGFDVTPR